MIKTVNKQNRESQPVQFRGFSLGENTIVPASQLLPQELAECINFKIRAGGRLETREGIVKYSDTEIGSLVDGASVSLSGTQKDVCSDADGKIYYMSSDTPTQIDTKTVGASAYLLGYNDVCLIMDGGYLKYFEDTSTIKMAYDAGTGGTFFDNYSGDQDSVTSISAAGVGCTFTTPAFGTGYTIPPTEVYFHGVENGGTASIEVQIIEANETSGLVMASKEYAGDVPSASADYISITFASGDITTELSPETEYYCLLKGSNFDLSHTTVASGGALITAGSTPDTTKDPVMRVHPGVPPKASFGCVSGNRPWIKDPDEPGLAKFGNLTHLDWSTSNGGGWVGVIDDSANSFEIGGMADLYGTLYVYGTQDQPFMCKLSGSTPSDYSLPLLFQRSWTTQKTLVNTANDLWSASEDGVDPLTGVQEFGDLRTFSASDPVFDKIRDNWASTAFAGYQAKDGQYWLYMPGYEYFIVCHTKTPIRMESGELRYPWTRYTCPATPTFCKQVGGNFWIGSSDGYIYSPDTSEYKDLSTTQIDPSFKTARIQLPFRRSDLVKVQFFGASISGSQFSFDIYRDGTDLESVYTWTVNFPMSDSLTVDELTMDIDDLLFTIDPEQTPLYFDINVTVRSFQLSVSSLKILGYPVFFDGILMDSRGLSI